MTTLKATVTTIKNSRGRVTGYRATIGEIEAMGGTPAEAREQCEARVLEAMERMNAGTETGSFRGHTFMVMPALYGWYYWLDTFSPGFCGQSARGTTKREAISYALHHLCQHVWTAEVDDAAFLADISDRTVQDELRGWIRFQRAYAWLQAGGVPDVQCHDLACQLSSAA